MDGPQSIEESTRSFCQKVIDSLTDQLRAQTVSNEIPEDQIDRLKSQWEQRLQNKLIQLD